MTTGWDDFVERAHLRSTELVSFVGGGGKTTALFAIGASQRGRTVITTTTKMGVERTGGLPVLLAPTDAQLSDALDEHGCVIAWQSSDAHRAVGVAPETCDRWRALADTIAVEADGSRRKPFKAPLDYEPVVPAASTLVVACVGMAAVGVPIREGCHRPERVAAVARCREDDPLTPERLVRVLLAPEGSRKGVPANARFNVLLNRVTPADRGVAAEIEASLAEAGVPLVVIPDLPKDRLPDRV